MEQEQADNGAIVKSKLTKPLRKVVYRWTFETASGLEYDKHSKVRYSRHKWNYPKLLLTECQYTHIHIVLYCLTPIRVSPIWTRALCALERFHVSDGPHNIGTEMFVAKVVQENSKVVI